MSAEDRWAATDDLLDNLIQIYGERNVSTPDIAVDLLCADNINHGQLATLAATAIQRAIHAQR
jgi:hypothetical protein